MRQLFLILTFLILGSKLNKPIKLVPLDRLAFLSIEEKYEELRKRASFTEWNNLASKQRIEIFNDLYNQSVKGNFEKGKLLATLLKIHISDIFSGDQRKKIKKQLSELQPTIEQKNIGFLTSYLYYLEGYVYYIEQNDKEAILAFEKALKHAKEFEKLLIYAHLSQSYRWLGNLERALETATLFNKEAQKYGYKNTIAQSYEQLGEIYLRKKDYAKSVDAAFKALSLFKELNSYYFQVRVLNLIAVNKFNLGKHDQQLKYLLDAEKLFNKNGIFSNLKASIYLNIASNYLGKQNYKEAEKYTLKAIKLAKEVDDHYILLSAELNYADLLSATNRAQKAIEVLEKVNQIDKKYWGNQEKSWYARYLAKAYIKLQEFAKAKPFMVDAISQSEKYDPLNVEIIYEEAISFFEAINDFKNANAIRKKHLDLVIKKQTEEMKKLLYSKENQSLVSKNLQNELILESQRTRMLMLAGFIMAFIIILVLQYNRNRVIKAKNLELKRKEAIVREKTADLQVILDNIHQGVVTVQLIDERTQQIKNTSLYFFEIFENLTQEDLINGGSLNKLFEGSSLNAEDLSKIRSIILSSTHESLWQWEVNESSLPREMSLIEFGKVIEIDWAVALENDLIHKVIITFKDVTELRKLSDKQKQNEINTKKLVTLALMDQREYFIFINSINQLMKESFEVISNHEQYLIEALDLAFRNLHTIKGLARTFDMILLSSFTHDIESVFQQTRDKTLAYNRTFLLEKLELLTAEIDTYKHLAKSKLKWDNELSSVSLPVKELTEWYRKIADLSGEFKVSENFKPLLQDIKRRYSSTLNDTLNNILLSSQKLSKELGKGEIQFELMGCEIFVDQSYQDKLSSVFVHLIRNSIDHGFVSVESRREIGLSSPKIKISLSELEAEFKLRYEDNGRGLNLLGIKQKATEKGLACNEKDPLDVARMIFISGFSTKQTVSDISGRGVGMDAVREYLVASGGDIELVPLSQEKDGFLPVSFELTLPSLFFDI